MRRYFELALLTLLAVVAQARVASAQTGIVFDDSDPAEMRLGNDYYEVSLSKDNGAILAILDKANGASLTLGSRNGCLWGGLFPGASAEYVGGCHYNAAGPNRFTYQWNPGDTTLTLTYSGDASAGPWVDATVTITASSDPYLDLRLSLANHGGATMQNALLPSDLVFADDQAQAGYGPFILPGAELKSSFFTIDRSYVITYPSYAAFAPYLALDVADGHLAIYTVNPDGPVRPLALGFIDNDTTQPDTFHSYFTFHTWVVDGATYAGPPVRMRVGQPVEESILAFRTENGIDLYPAIGDKLGAQFDQLAQAPLIKADIWAINKPFSQWIPDLDRLPSPALLHPVAFQPRGHDENYPDFLPPDPRWGSTEDFRAMVAAAHARDILVMPYTNPTWWDEESPTLGSRLPSTITITDTAVQDAAGMPVKETYGGVHVGYVMSPYVSFVQDRLEQLMQQWQDEVPVDFVFEDQLGARAWLQDHNPAAPSPLSYADGWLDHAATYADRGLMTEMGWDRLARAMLGFHGSLLTWARVFDYANDSWGAGNWEPYPLALWLFHDKVLLYQHDLAPETMSEDRGVLAWNLAFGTMLSYNWQWADNDPLNSPWLDLVALLQRTVAARYAGRPLAAFARLSADVTRTTFDDLSIDVNWHPSLTYTIDGHGVAPGGYYARTADASVLAGVFVGSFNDRGLSAGEHYLIMERTPDQATVYQPVGETTFLAVDAPANWQPGQQLHVRAYDRTGTLLDDVSYWMDERRVNFVYQKQWYSRPVGRYEIDLSSVAGDPCLVNGDPVVDIIDVQSVAGAFGESVPPAPLAYDLLQDGHIDAQDIVLAAQCWLNVSSQFFGVHSLGPVSGPSPGAGSVRRPARATPDY